MNKISREINLQFNIEPEHILGGDFNGTCDDLDRNNPMKAGILVRE